MKPVYINSAKCISAQDTLEDFDFKQLQPHTTTLFLNAIAPNYKEYIPPALIRRMSKTVKMSSVAAQNALAEAGVEKPDAIIVGTGMGCEEDSEKFLKNVIENNEEFLTPTHFIQSTHNTVAGQIALVQSCHAYNFTYVNTGSSLEMSLLDASLQLQNGESNAVLVGGTDEKAARTMELYQLNGTIKKEAYLPADYLNAETPGVIWGEGSAFFVLDTRRAENTRAELADTCFTNRQTPEEVPEFIRSFLAKNQLQPSDIDVILTGFSGDAASDTYYKEALPAFGGSAQLYFKHLCGEYNTASGFALFMACAILKKQQIPEVMRMNSNSPSEICNVLIYNHLLGEDHSLILLKRC